MSTYKAIKKKWKTIATILFPAITISIAMVMLEIYDDKHILEAKDWFIFSLIMLLVWALAIPMIWFLLSL